MRAAAFLALVLLCAAAACQGPQQDPKLGACMDDDAAPALALEACTRYLATPGLSADQRAAALAQRASLHQGLNDNAAALQDYNAAIEANPNDAPTLARRAGLYQTMADFPHALADVTAAIRLQPQGYYYYYYRAQLYDEGLHDYVHAIADMNTAVDLSGANANMLNARCWIRGKAGRALDLALADCERSLQVRPNNANVLDSRALVHLRLGHFQNAYDDFSAALKGDASLYHSRYGLGVAALRLGRKDEGRADIAIALKGEADLADIYHDYGEDPDQVSPAAPSPGR
ncbi:MAG: hypothetical protein ABUL42_03910 [Terricaulis silvestris]